MHARHACDAAAGKLWANRSRMVTHSMAAHSSADSFIFFPFVGRWNRNRTFKPVTRRIRTVFELLKSRILRDTDEKVRFKSDHVLFLWQSDQIRISLVPSTDRSGIKSKAKVFGYLIRQLWTWHYTAKKDEVELVNLELHMFKKFKFNFTKE